MQTTPIITNAQARGTLDSLVPADALVEPADALIDAAGARLDALTPDMLAAFAILGATRQDLLRHLAHEAIEAAFA